MGAITREQLKQGLIHIYESWSNKEDLDPSEARSNIAEAQANLFADYVDGRLTQVTGVTSEGKTVTGTGIIQED